MATEGGQAVWAGERVVVSDAGLGAASISDLFTLMTITGTIVLVIFCGLLLYGLLHRRGRAARRPTPVEEQRRTRWIVILGGVVPTLVLLPILGYTMYTLDANDPGGRTPDLVVEVTGRQWWWEYRYLDPDPARVFRTANELHVPVGRRVELRLTSVDVIHSFWVPSLQGKMDLIPGRVNVTWLEATRPGEYGGQCAEYCGLQHARMGLLVVAQPADEFEAWAARQRASAAAPRDSLTLAGQRAFEEAACSLCHTIRGTRAGGLAGPDLTHVAGRRTLAAGVVPNSPGHLAGWVANPDALKPGTRMPRVPMSPDAFRLMRHYLATLR